MTGWRGPEYEGEFPSLGWDVVDWIERYLCHGPGDVLGQRIDLDDELAAFIVKAYCIDPETGRRVYRRVHLSRPKGRAKSELAAMLVCAEALAGVRFAGWDARGEPVGKPVSSPFIRVMATEESQAGNTYDHVFSMLSHVAEKHGGTYPGLDIGLTRVFLPGKGEIVPSTASGAAKDGGRESFAVFDEVGLYITPELKRMHATVLRNLRKRKAADPWSLETATMFCRGEGSIGEASHAYAQQIREGKVKETGFLLDHKEAPADTDLSDRDSLMAGLRYVYGPASEWMDLEGIISSIWDPQSDPAESRRYWLGQSVTASSQWLSEPEWAGAMNLSAVVSKTDPCVLGFDGSRSRTRGNTDATALIGCRVSDFHLFELGVWEQPTGPAGVDWQVPIAEVEAVVRKAFNDFKIVGFYADPSLWEGQVAGWEAQYGSRLKVRATQSHPIGWYMTGGRSNLIVRALAQFHEAVVSKELSHDGSAALTRHALNARRRPSRSGMQIGKEHPDSVRKVDALVAAVLSYQCALDARSKGLGEARGGRGRIIVMSG
jgi:phage terminase large subunit-like protein